MTTAAPAGTKVRPKGTSGSAKIPVSTSTPKKSQHMRWSTAMTLRTDMDAFPLLSAFGLRFLLRFLGPRRRQHHQQRHDPGGPAPRTASRPPRAASPRRSAGAGGGRSGRWCRPRRARPVRRPSSGRRGSRGAGAAGPGGPARRTTRRRPPSRPSNRASVKRAVLPPVLLTGGQPDRARVEHSPVGPGLPGVGELLFQPFQRPEVAVSQAGRRGLPGPAAPAPRAASPARRPAAPAP